MTDSLSVGVDGEEWTEVAELATAGPDDKVFVSAEGSITFGDGIHGRRPPEGATVQATYREGRGEAGNVRVSIAVQWPPPERQFLATLGRNGRISLMPIGASACGFAGVKRVRYFHGQLLRADDFRDEQDYARHKRWLHNRLLHGAGIVSGLKVGLSPDTPPQVLVEPGLALDPTGREVALAREVRLTICEDHSPQLVVVEYTEREVDPVISLEDPLVTEASRIEEGALVRLSKEDGSGDGVPIGRILACSTGWTLDLDFEASRAR